MDDLLLNCFIADGQMYDANSLFKLFYGSWLIASWFMMGVSNKALDY